MFHTKPTMADIIAYREANETGLDEARRAVWKRWRINTIKSLRAWPRGENDEIARELLDVLESIEAALQ